MCVTRVRLADTWKLVDAASTKDLGKVLALFADVYDPRDRGLPLVGAIAWSLRQLLKLQAALASGASIDEAARRAGIYPAVPRARARAEAEGVPPARARTLARRRPGDRRRAQELAPAGRRDPRRDVHADVPQSGLGAVPNGDSPVVSGLSPRRGRRGLSWAPPLTS